MRESYTYDEGDLDPENNQKLNEINREVSEPDNKLFLESVSERDMGHLFESGSEYESESESEPDRGLHFTDFDVPPTDSMRRELSTFEMLVTVENERKRQARMIEQARMVEDALSRSDSFKEPRKHLD